jgi:uncharacterized protein YjbJ (UPF0337 family)
MNQLQWKGNWNLLKGRLKKAVGEITHDGPIHDAGQRDEVTGQIQRRLGQAKASFSSI